MSEVRKAVQKLYNTYPFPPDPLLDEPPPGYNWRWHYQSAYNFCAGMKPSQEKIRILDAGCGTGSGTEYLVLHNPYADIIAIDLSENALATAKKRLEKSGVLANFHGTITFKQLPLETVDTLEENFDFINCVGVLHHLPEPEIGIKALAQKFQASGSALFINKIINGQDDINEDTTVWRLTSNPDQFKSYLKNKINNLIGK